MICTSRIQHDFLRAMYFSQWQHGVLCWKQDDFFLGGWHLLRISFIHIFQQLFILCTLCKYFCSNFLMGTKYMDWSLFKKLIVTWIQIVWKHCLYRSLLISPTRWTKINISSKTGRRRIFGFLNGLFPSLEAQLTGFSCQNALGGSFVREKLEVNQHHQTPPS